MGYFPRRHDDGVHELLVVWVSLLEFVEDLAEVVDWPLDCLYFSFFQAFDHECCAYHAASCCDVQEQQFLLLWYCQDWQG